MLGANLSSLFVGHWTAMLILYADAHPWDEVTMQGRKSGRKRGMRESNSSRALSMLNFHDCS
jgi:hypothetical protein